MTKQTLVLQKQNNMFLKNMLQPAGSSSGASIMTKKDQDQAHTTVRDIVKSVLKGEEEKYKGNGGFVKDTFFTQMSKENGIYVARALKDLDVNERGQPTSPRVQAVPEEDHGAQDQGQEVPLQDWCDEGARRETRDPAAGEEKRGVGPVCGGCCGSRGRGLSACLAVCYRLLLCCAALPRLAVCYLLLLC